MLFDFRKSFIDDFKDDIRWTISISVLLESNQIKIKMAKFEASFQRKPTMLMHQYELNLNYARNVNRLGVCNDNYEISEDSGINGKISIQYSPSKLLKVQINNAKQLRIDASRLLINGKNDKDWSRQCYANEWSAYFNETICSVNGSIIITFEENEALSIRRNFRDIFAKLTLENVAKSGKNDKFIVAVSQQQFEFDKATLCMLSPVFKRMIENHETEESKSNKVEIIDFPSETIETFQALLNGGESLKTEKITGELLMFADKYDISSLRTFCEDHFVITKENTLGFTKAGYLINNEKILKAVAKFFRENKLTLDEGWKEFQKNYPDAFVKLMNFLCFVEQD